jgi:uncharacterized membrane protein YraQ (UPF0718 family)
MAEKVKHRGIGGWVFLSLVLIAYAGLSLVKPSEATQSLSFFMQVMQQVIPVLGLVFVLLFIANLFLEHKWIKCYLGQQAGIKGWLVAVLGGVVSIGPVYAWYAILSEMQAKGMRTALIATFLYSRAVKLPLLPLMIHYFGFGYTLILCLYLMLFAVINGMLVEKLLPKKLAGRI